MAYNLDGNDGLYNLSWNSPSSNTFTIGARIRLTNNTTIFAVLMNWGDGIRGMFHFNTSASATLQLYVNEGDDNQVGPASGGSLSTDTWYAVIGQANGSNLKVFVDGSQVGSDVAYDGTLDQSRNGIGIGVKLDDTLTTSGAQPLFLNGHIAEAFVSTAVWTTAEIAAFNTYSPLLIRRPASYWPLIREKVAPVDGTALSEFGAPAVSAHPRVIYPRPRRLIRTGAAIVYNFMRPDADDTDGTWTDQSGGTSLFAAIDETVVDDADYIQSVQAPVNDLCKIRISDPSVAPGQPFKVRYRYKKTGTAAIDLRVRLLEGTTVIATWTHSDIGTDFLTTTQTLSGGEFASITDFNNLYIEFRANAP
jgi:Concanavalin A-like lectin/glucanases superfamily